MAADSTLMRAFMIRELIAIIRRPAFAVALMVHLAIVSGFVLLWHRGLPTTALAFHEQASWFNVMALALILPWTAIRCTPDDYELLAELSVLTALRPSAIVAGKAAGVAAALAVFVAATIPVMIIAVDVSGAPLPVIVGHGVTLAALTALSAGVAVAARAFAPAPGVAWIGATLAITPLVWMTIDRGLAPLAAIVWLGVGCGAAALATVRYAQVNTWVREENDASRR